MEHDQVYIRPGDVLLPQADNTAVAKSPEHTPLPEYVWDDSTTNNDERFVRYASSPESIISYNDEFTFSPIEDENNSLGTRNLLDRVRERVLPYQDPVESVQSFPFALDPLDESLLSTYLSEYYENVNGFVPQIRPHPTAAVFSIAMTNPALLHLVIALSAQYRLVTNQYSSRRQQYRLECSIMKHKDEALQIIRNLGSPVTPGQHSTDMIASIVGLGMLDRLSNDEDMAAMHFNACRQILKTIGGPLQLQNVWFSRMLAHFESGYGPVSTSAVWDKTDFKEIHTDINQFFNTLWTIRQGPSSRRPSSSRRGSRSSISSQSSPTKSSVVSIGLKENTVLFECLSRQPLDIANPTPYERRELLFQITCLLLLCSITYNHRSDPQGLESYIDSVHDLVEASPVANSSVNNVMWLLQAHDHSDAHSKRVWAVTGWVWILRHVNYNVQAMVKGWLIAMTTGKPVPRALKLDSFAFSYAS